MGVAKSMTLRGGGGGGGGVPTLSVTMTLIFPKIVWTCPLRPERSVAFSSSNTTNINVSNISCTRLDPYSESRAVVTLLRCTEIPYGHFEIDLSNNIFLRSKKFILSNSDLET